MTHIYKNNYVHFEIKQKKKTNNLKIKFNSNKWLLHILVTVISLTRHRNTNRSYISSITSPISSRFLLNRHTLRNTTPINVEVEHNL